MKFINAASLCLLFSITILSTSSIAADGVINVKSKFNVPHTVDRFKAIITKKGMKVFAQINHSEGAKHVGIDLPKTELVIFGNPRVGSPLMECARSFAIDLPQKMLIWKDRAGQVWLSYNDPVYLADRHGLEAHCRKSLKKIAGALAKFSSIAGGVD